MLVRHRAVVAVLLTLLGGVFHLHAQTVGLQLGGPLSQCRPAWDFAAGGVQAHFSAGYLVGPASQPPRFEVNHLCGNSRLTISLSEWVKNVQMRVSAGTHSAQVLGGGSVNPGGSGRIVTVPGPTAFIFLWSSGDGRITVDQISFELGDPPALFSFAATTTGRVLTHKYRSDDAYPSSLQTEDGKIRVEGLVHDLTGSTGISERKVYFRLIDPPDTADYVVKAGDATVNDNVDGPGKLNGSATATGTSDSSGKVSVTLEITDHAAGDNYQVEASLDQNFNCSPAPCQKSIVYTAWKRVYVEAHKMFKVGSFIAEPVKPGDKKIVVDDIQGFPRAPFKVRLIHASKVEDPAAGFYSETVDIIEANSNHDGNAELILAGQSDPGVPGVIHAYVADEKVKDKERLYLRDAIGVVTGDRRRDYWLTNGKLASRPFEDAFVEYVWLTDSVVGVDDDLLPTQSRIPFDGVIASRTARIGEADKNEREWLTRKWMRSSTRPTKGERSATPNHQVLFVATKHAFRDKQKSVYKGLTTVADDFNDTWVFVQERDMSNASYQGESTLHELTHQWRVNALTPSGGDAGGHCDVALPDPPPTIYNRAPLLCMMSANVYATSEASDGVVGFHYRKQNGEPADSEFLRIRRRSEPVPQKERTGRNPQ